MKNRLYESKDEQLFSEVRKLKAGSSGDYNAVYELSNKYLYKIVNDIVKNQDDTEDILQEAYLQIYNKINTLNEVESFYVWAGRIATNMTYRYIQKNRKELLLSGDEEENEFFFDNVENDDEAFIPETVVENKESQRLIAGIINSLSTEQKLCIQYYYYEEMSVNDIAEAMECSTGTVKSRLNYARKAIKDGVLSLEVNEGTKLYSLAAFPVFALIFRQELSGWLLKAADLVMPFFTSGGVYHAAAVAGGVAIAGGSIGGGAQIAGGSIGGGAQVAGGSIGGSAAVTAATETASVGGTGAAVTTATETVTVGGTGAAVTSSAATATAATSSAATATAATGAAATSSAATATAATATATTAAVTAGLSKGAIAGIIIATTVSTGGIVGSIVGVNQYNKEVRIEAEIAAQNELARRMEDADSVREIYSATIEKYEQMGVPESEILERLVLLDEKEEQIYMIQNDMIESYEEMKEGYRICLSDEQYDAAQEYFFDIFDKVMAEQMSQTENFIGIMTMEPDSPEMQTLYDKYVRFARSNSELTDKSVALIEHPLSQQIMAQYTTEEVRANLSQGINVPTMILNYMHNSNDGTYNDLVNLANETIQLSNDYLDAMNDYMNYASTNQEVLRISGEYAMINALKENEMTEILGNFLEKYGVNN